MEMILKNKEYYEVCTLPVNQFEQRLCDHDDFARMYLVKNLPKNFDISVLSETSLEAFGRDILEQKQGSITPYGVVLGRGESLYEPVLADVELVHEISEDIKFGGMSL